jgi:hypothetical protein
MNLSSGKNINTKARKKPKVHVFVIVVVVRPARAGGLMIV